MAKLSNKKITDLLESIKWSSGDFDPENGNFDEVFYTDKNFFKYALITNGDVLRYGSDEFKSDKELIKMAVISSTSALEFISDELKSDKEFILELLQLTDISILSYVPDSLLKDKDFISLFNPKDLSFLLEDKFDLIKGNRELVLNILTSNGYYLRYLPDEWKNDFEAAKIACTNNANAFDEVSDELKANKEVLLAAISRDGKALERASDELKADREIAKIAVKSYGAAICCLPDTLKNDKEIIKLALLSRTQLNDAMPCFPKDLLADREFAKELLCIEADIFPYIDVSFQKDAEFKLLKKIMEL